MQGKLAWRMGVRTKGVALPRSNRNRSTGEESRAPESGIRSEALNSHAGARRQRHHEVNGHVAAERIVIILLIIT